MDELRFCVKCGHELIAGACFCPYCGTRTQTNIDPITQGAVYENYEESDSDIESKAKWEGNVQARGIPSSRIKYDNSVSTPNSLHLRGIDILIEQGVYSFSINGVVQEQTYAFVEVWIEWSNGYLFTAKQLGGGRRRAIINFSRKDNSLKKITDFIFPDVSFEGYTLYKRADKEWDYDRVFKGEKRIISSIWPTISNRPVLIVHLAMDSIDNLPSGGFHEAWLGIDYEEQYPLLRFYDLKRKNLVIYKSFDAVGRWSWNLWANELYWTNNE